MMLTQTMPHMFVPCIEEINNRNIVSKTAYNHTLDFFTLNKEILEAGNECVDYKPNAIPFLYVCLKTSAGLLRKITLHRTGTALFLGFLSEEEIIEMHVVMKELCYLYDVGNVAKGISTRDQRIHFLKNYGINSEIAKKESEDAFDEEDLAPEIPDDENQQSDIAVPPSFDTRANASKDPVRCAARRFLLNIVRPELMRTPIRREELIAGLARFGNSKFQRIIKNTSDALVEKMRVVECKAPEVKVKPTVTTAKRAADVIKLIRQKKTVSANGPF